MANALQMSIVLVALLSGMAQDPAAPAGTGDPVAPLAIRANYLTPPDDLEHMLRGFKLARRILGSKAFTPYRGEEIVPGRGVNSDDEIRDFIRAKAETIYHPIGTCKMGDAARDPRAWVLGTTTQLPPSVSVRWCVASSSRNTPRATACQRPSTCNASTWSNNHGRCRASPSRKCTLETSTGFSLWVRATSMMSQDRSR